jgi:hypothetical protein
VKARADGQSILLDGDVYYGPLPGSVTIQVLPTFALSAKPPKIEDLLRQIGMLASRQGGYDITIEPDGVPALHLPVSLQAPLFGGATFAASTTVHARANGQIQLGSVGVTIPGWLPVAYISIGRAHIDLDLDHLDRLGLGATVAITSGEATSYLLEAPAMLRHDHASLANPARIHVVASLTYSGAIVGDGGNELIFSGLATSIDSVDVVCSRRANWSALKQRFEQANTPNSALTGLEVNATWAKQLLSNNGDVLFLHDLLNPQVSLDRYHRSPMQFFPTPTLASKSCLQVN